MDFLTLDNIFVLDNFKIVLDNNFFSGQKDEALGKKILSVTKIICLGQNISTVHESIKMTSLGQKLTVSSGRVIFLDLYVAEMNFLAMDKMFCLRQKSFVPDKIDFV